MDKPHDEKQLLSLVNSSGFLLQESTERVISERSGRHSFTVHSREHGWKNGRTGGSGYIDLVLGQQEIRVVVECKRVRDGDWIFLVPDDESQPRSHAKLIWGYKDPVLTSQTFAPPRIGSYDFIVEPKSVESRTCIIRGKGEDEKAALLERLAGILLQSTEALVFEESFIGSHRSIPLTVHIPAIVTTARLVACVFHKGDIDQGTGEIGKAEFEEVPFLRFRKSLVPRGYGMPDLRSLAEMNNKRERTVFVVNSMHVNDFLYSIRYEEGTLDGKKPWEQGGTESDPVTREDLG